MATPPLIGALSVPVTGADTLRTNSQFEPLRRKRFVPQLRLLVSAVSEETATRRPNSAKPTRSLPMSFGCASPTTTLKT
jgi:hypothetical protein